MTDARRIRLDPDPLEPYFLSQGFRVGDLVVVSGQAALDEHGVVVGAGDFDAQAEQVFRNLERVLAAAGSGLDRVVKVTIFLTDTSYFGSRIWPSSISISSSGNASACTCTIVSAG